MKLKFKGRNGKSDIQKYLRDLFQNTMCLENQKFYIMSLKLKF